MKTLVTIFAVALALAFTAPAFAQDVSTAKTPGRVRGGWRRLGC
jgi:hypothetical protein